MTLATDIRKIKENAEIERIKQMEESIENKLNYDGRWNVCHPMEGITRLAHLTRSESDYLGKRMGWDVPYYGGVDWDAVPTPFLAQCTIHSDGMDLLRTMYPAPAGTEITQNQEP